MLERFSMVYLNLYESVGLQHFDNNILHKSPNNSLECSAQYSCSLNELNITYCKNCEPTYIDNIREFIPESALTFDL